MSAMKVEFFYLHKLAILVSLPCLTKLKQTYASYYSQKSYNPVVLSALKDLKNVAESLPNSIDILGTVSTLLNMSENSTAVQNVHISYENNTTNPEILFSHDANAEADPYSIEGNLVEDMDLLGSKEKIQSQEIRRQDSKSELKELFSKLFNMVQISPEELVKLKKSLSNTTKRSVGKERCEDTHEVRKKQS